MLHEFFEDRTSGQNPSVRDKFGKSPEIIGGQTISFFLKISAPIFFLEDDLVLSVNHLRVIDRLLKIAEAFPSIGYVSAYGDLWASLERQGHAPGQLQPITRIGEAP